jgi:hypothetical protein
MERLQMYHASVGCVGEYVEIVFEQFDSQQPVMVGRLVFGGIPSH